MNQVVVGLSPVAVTCKQYRANIMSSSLSSLVDKSINIW